MRSGKGLAPAKETEKEESMKLGETQESALVFLSKFLKNLSIVDLQYCKESVWLRIQKKKLLMRD